MARILGAIATSHTPTIGFAYDRNKGDDPVWAPIFEAYRPIQQWLADNKPDVLFMDEPFSALDFETTLLMRARLQEAQTRLGMTTLIVSHDLEEAVYLADTVLLLTRHPTRIAARIAYTEPRPRPPEIVTEPVFVETKRRCLEIFRREARL